MKTPVAILGIVLLLSSTVMAADSSVPPPQDRSFKILPGIQAVYPARMLSEGISHGEARAVLHVNSEGQLVDHLIVAYTHQAFGDEAARVVQRWKYVPAIVKGEAVDTIVEVAFSFEVNGVLLVQRFGLERSEVDTFGGYEYSACNLKNLDRIPAPLDLVSPTYPKEWGDQGIAGNVVVDFYIDEEGKTRLATAPVSSYDQLAGIAVAAVSKWRFAPPTRKGKPVLVHARQVFDFRRAVADNGGVAPAAK